MNVQLREGNFDVIRLEGYVKLFKKVALKHCEVTSVAPHADGDLNRGVLHSGHTNEGSGVLEGKGVSGDNVCYNRLCLFDISAVSDVESEVETASFFSGVVNGNGVNDDRVGNVYGEVITRFELGIEDTDVLNSTRLAADLNEIVYLDGFEDKQHNSADEVGECALYGKSDSSTEGCENRDDRRHFNAESTDDADSEENVKPKLYYVTSKFVYRRFKLFSHFFVVFNALNNEFDDSATYYENNECYDKTPRNVNAAVNEGVENCIPIHNF